MATNEEIAALLDELGDRLLLEGESWFKVSAYRRASTTFRALTEDLRTVAAEHRLRKLSGVGEAISSKVEAYLATGHIPTLDHIREAQPEGLLRLFRQTGIAPRWVRALAQGPMQIDSPEKLRAVMDSGAFEAVKPLEPRERDALAKWRAGLPD